MYNLPNSIRRDRRCYEHPGPRPKHVGGAQVSASYFKVCPVCRKEFRVYACEGNKRVTCSHACYGELKRGGNPMQEFTCPICGKRELRKPSRADRPYCSRACYAVSQRTGVKSRNPITRRASQANGKAWRRGASRDQVITAQQWQGILDYFNQRCAYCGEEGALDLEHIVSISVGGRHVVENIVPSCRSCNQSKRTRSLLAWLAAQIRPETSATGKKASDAISDAR